MKFKESSAAARKLPLANDHFVSVAYDCSSLTSLATDGVIPAGTIVPANDATAVGVLLTDVVLAENPNGTIVVHGFIETAKLPAAPSEDNGDAIGAKTALKQIMFI